MPKATKKSPDRLSGAGQEAMVTVKTAIFIAAAGCDYLLHQWHPVRRLKQRFFGINDYDTGLDERRS
jgi:hypothetical protein